MLRLIYPTEKGPVELLTPVQSEFIQKVNSLGTEKALDWLLPVKDSRECSYQQPLTLRWEPDGSSVYTLELCEDGSEHGRKYECPGPECTVTNLKVRQSYTVLINGTKAGSFSTAPAPYRFIKIDGVQNLRDIGGINIKQGYVYRGSDFMGHYHITDDGIRTFCDELGIRTELDLQMESDPFRPLPFETGRVKAVHLPYRPYLECFEEEHRKGICRIMDFFADESVYPVYVHCFGGADRTGMVAMFLRALLGESDDDMLLDYELTSLSMYAGGVGEGIETQGFRSRNNEYFAMFLEGLSRYGKGLDLSSQVLNFLLDCGVTEETIEKIRAILGR
ncbi:MAG: tyrosine-protein phosphatase [Clostridia bacterium]|nr:tyrosine-protein phosphatase [Clostridia bacterium]